MRAVSPILPPWAVHAGHRETTTNRPSRIRTDDSLLVRQELYQLSYRPKKVHALLER